MDERCCTLCAHNPYLGERRGWLSRAYWWLAWRLFRKQPPAQEGPPGCLKNSQLFCYDVRGSAGCQRSLATARPEFLACKSCGGFAPQHKVPGNG